MAEEYRAHAFVGVASSPYTHRSPSDMVYAARLIQQREKLFQQRDCVSVEILV